MQRHPLVSIGIPTFNRPKGLINTLNFLLNQTYKSVEIIISDNCSDEEHQIEQIAGDYISKSNFITYFKQEKNIGALNNFEFLLNKATGKYFMWAADDDEWEPGFIEELVSILESDGKAGLAFCNYDYIFNLSYISEIRNNWTQLALTKNSESLTGVLQLTLKGEVPADIIYGLFRREICVELFGFMKRNDLWERFASDKIFNFVVLSKTKLALTENVLYRVHVNSESMSVGMHKGITSEVDYRKGLFKAVRKCKLNPFLKLKLLGIVSLSLLELYTLIFRGNFVKLMIKLKIHKYYRLVKSKFTH